MANQRSAVRRFPTRAARRPTNWIASADISGFKTLGGASVVLDQSFSAAQISAIDAMGLTVVRTRGTLWVQSDQVVASEEPFGALGFMVVKDAARVAGVASLPTPITEEFDDGFFVHQFWQAGLTFVQQDASGVTIGNYWSRYDFDSKAMRKITEDDSMVVTLENASADDALNYILKFRMLVKAG